MNIYHLLSDKEWSGNDQYVLDLACRQRQDGHYVEIVCRNVEAVIVPFKAKEFPISTIPLKGITDLESAMRLARVIKKGKNVIIHAHNFKDAFTGCMARKLSENRGTKVIMTRHLVKRGRSGMLYHRLYSDINKIVFVSELARSAFKSSHPKIQDKKLAVIHGSILTSDKKGVDIRSNYNISPEKVILMYHGRLAPEKGLHILLRAASMLNRNKIHLFIAGVGDEKYVSELNTIMIANRLEGCVTFMGYINNPQNYLRGCDIGVLPSIVPEALGLSNMEYMMAGKPVIASNNGAQTEYIESGVDGILVPANDPVLLADTISSLVNDIALREKIGKAAAQKFETELSYERFYDNMSKLYNDL